MRSKPTEHLEDALPGGPGLARRWLVAGLIAIAVSRFEVTAWPRISLLTMTPSRVAFAAIGAGSGLASDSRTYLLFLLDIPLAVGLVLLVAGVNAPAGERPGLVLGAVAAALIGTWAHVRFWRRRAARRYLETRSGS